MKPLVFIGSSSEKGKERDWLQYQLDQRDILAEPWNSSKVFTPSASTWESLNKKVHDYDFGVFILTPDDTLTRQGKTFDVSRDNVILELGLFAGALGRERVFFLVPNDIENRILPSDLSGITWLGYSSEDFRARGPSALGPAATQIAEQIELLGRRKTNTNTLQKLTPELIEEILDVSALVGAYRTRVAALAPMLSDIESARYSIRMYSRVYLSNLVKGELEFQDSIRYALSNATRSFDITSTVSSFESHEIASRLYHLEDPDKTRWPTFEIYQDHLRTANRTVQRLRTGVLELANHEFPNLDIEFKTHKIDDILPYSLLVIDRSIVYASFYRLSRSPYGIHAPTIRIENVKEKRDWADVFMEEADFIDNMSQPIS